MNKTALKFFWSLVLSLVCILPVQSQVPTPPFKRGVNLTNWFQSNSTREINFRRYTKNDFENIKSLGFDVIRLPINLKAMTGGAPDYVIDPLFFTFLDSAVVWAESLDLHLIMDNHSFNVEVNTVPDDVIYLKKVWQQMAHYYRSNPASIYYEILNEPHGISDNEWNEMQRQVIEEIRNIDKEHTIIVGPANWNSFHNLSALPVYNDDNLIYTFHFYDPFLFTHQGAGWVNPSLVPLQGIPFPYDENSMPVLDQSFKGTWIESAYNNYVNEGTEENIRNLLDKAIEFRDTRNVPVFCGEFGVLQDHASAEERANWYNVVQNKLDSGNIAWTMWDYHGGFGLFEKGSTGLFHHDLNVQLLQALDLNVPEQTPYIKKADTVGFIIYDEFIGSAILNSSWTAGSLNFYSDERSNNGNLNIHWNGASLYNNIGFNFYPDKDLSELVNQDYAIDMFVRGIDLPENFTLDIRFVDTKINEQDRPWRNRYTVSESIISFDGKWHHLHLKLADFTEHGAWDNGWFSPEGKFDWSDIDKIEFSTESMAMENGSLWFDNIILTNQDTARIWNSSHINDPVDPVDPVVSLNNKKVSKNEVIAYPNPTKNILNIKLSCSSRENELLYILDVLGNILITSEAGQNDIFRVNCSYLNDGVYFFSLPKSNIYGKFIKNSKVD